MLTPETRVTKFLSLLGEILDDPKSTEILRERIARGAGLR